MIPDEKSLGLSVHGKSQAKEKRPSSDDFWVKEPRRSETVSGEK